MTTDNIVFIVGAGSVGLALAHALVDSDVEVSGIWNRSARSLDALPDGVPLFVSWDADGLRDAIHSSAIVILAVSDQAIGPCSTKLLEFGLIGPNTTLAHTSGCSPVSTITPAAGIYRGGIHPLTAIPSATKGRARLRTCVYGIEGDGPAHDRLHALANTLGGRPFSLATEKRAQYHAAAVMASNLLVGVMDMAIEEAKNAGLKDPTPSLIELALGAIRSIGESGVQNALTGPIVRGDSETVAAHLEALDNPSRATYQHLSARLLSIAKTRDLEPDRLAELEKLLS
jgi:predicted short-subunit dehydrogenase-like oxidoreductase (DUF2520 family)